MLGAHREEAPSPVPIGPSRLMPAMPTLTMSLTNRCPEEKAIELGGVETGSMKAYEQPTVPGIMR